MAAPKRARAKPGLKATAEALSVAPAADLSSGLVTVTLFDGTRQRIQPGTPILLTVHDGAQNQLFRDEVNGPGIALHLPVHNNFADNYSIVAFAEGFEQAGFLPVKIGPNAPQKLDLMLLPKDGDYHFAQAKWTDLLSKKPLLSRIFSDSLTGDPGTAYGDLMEDHPDHLACMLNITTAMEQVFLPDGTPLEYLKEFDLTALAPDRIFGYADAKLVDQVRLAAQHGQFQTQPPIDLTLHGDATSSFKQIQFGEANLQLTFHEKNRKVINGVDCVYVEPDIDYFKDPGAHFLLEVIPNKLSQSVSSPRTVYVLRWIAGQHSGIPNFDPLYTIE